jgi:antitoxin MazE
MIVEALDLEEGDEIEIRIAGKREFKVARDRSREKRLRPAARWRDCLPQAAYFASGCIILG